MSALVIVDIQNDFLPGGSFAVKDGDEILPIINQVLDKPFDLYLATKDWHPKDHGSFAAVHKKKTGDVIQLDGIEQILWPIHCVQDTPGADFSPRLNTRKFEKVFHKGTDKNIDSYSTFFDNEHRKSTGLDTYLKERGIKNVYLSGLTTEYCIKYSALDARALGFNVYVIIDGCRGINLHPDDAKKAIEEMKKAGVHLIKSSDL